jgi:hypothetical protein
MKLKALLVAIALSVVASPVFAGSQPLATHGAASVSVAEPIENQPPPPEPIENQPPPPPSAVAG